MTLFQNYQRNPISFQSADNAIWTDDEGTKYSDLSSGIGVYNVGANNPKVKKALLTQVDKIWHTPNMYHIPLQEQVAKKLGGDSYTTYFANSGTEANEAAIKLARLATGKSTIISFKNSFHGRTYGSMSATGQESIHAGYPMLEGFKYAKFNDIDSVIALIDDNTAAIMLELVQGEGGIFKADQLFINQLSEVAKKHNILIIIDEIQTGLGRTGQQFAFKNYHIEPDIFTSAKALANGLPVGAMLAKNKLAKAFSKGKHGSTFGGNPLVMSAAYATLESLDDILPTLSDKMTIFWDKLKEFETLEVVEEVRGIGMMAGISLNTDVNKVVSNLLEQNIITLSAGHNTLRLLPPLTIPTEQLIQSLDQIKIYLASLALPV